MRGEAGRQEAEKGLERVAVVVACVGLPGKRVGQGGRLGGRVPGREVGDEAERRLGGGERLEEAWRTGEAGGSFAEVGRLREALEDGSGLRLPWGRGGGKG